MKEISSKPTIEERWNELLSYARKELSARGQDPGLLGADLRRFTLSLPLDGPQPFLMTFNEQAVLGGNLQRLAIHFYAAFEAAMEYQLTHREVGGSGGIML